MARLLVVDASVLLKWVLPPDNERHVEHALAIRDLILRGTHELCLPPLWFFEVGNTFARKAPEKTAIALNSILGLSPAEVPLHELIAPANDLAARFAVTFYDASYHACALVRQGTLVTDDDQYFNKVQSVESIVRLADWR